MKTALNEVKLDARIKTALRVINDKLGIQKKHLKALQFGLDDLEMTGAMMQYIDDLSTSERKVLIDVIKSITLLTSGNVKSVRSRGRTFDSELAEPWTEILSYISEELLTYMKFDVNQKVTKKDYAMAARMLSSLSSQTNVVASPMEKYTKLHRGMSRLDKNTINFLFSTDRLIIPHGSSFSTDLIEAWKFATNTQYNTLYIIDNPEMKGLDARGLSKYPHENEVIFSGEIRIDKITINNNRSNAKEPYEISEADFIIDPKESFFDKGLKSMIIDALPEKEDTFTMNMGVDLPNGKRLHRPMFIFHGTVV